MKRYIRPAAIAAALIGGIYGLLLLGAAAAPAPAPQVQPSESSLIADRLAADASLLAHPGAPPAAR